MLCSALVMTKVSSTNLSHMEGGRVGTGTKGFDLKLFHVQVGYEGTDGRTHSCTMDLFIKLTLEEEACVFKAELQKSEYLLDGHVGPLG